jgi:DNA-binding GntR family transcriptional regulator
MNKEPVWRQIVDDIAADIDSGKCPPGMQLLPLPELREQYVGRLGREVSVSTVQKALDVLEYVGMIESRHGVGFFVIGPNPCRTGAAGG